MASSSLPVNTGVSFNVESEMKFNFQSKKSKYWLLAIISLPFIFNSLVIFVATFTNSIPVDFIFLVVVAWFFVIASLFTCIYLGKGPIKILLLLFIAPFAHLALCSLYYCAVSEEFELLNYLGWFSVLAICYLFIKFSFKSIVKN